MSQISSEMLVTVSQSHQSCKMFTISLLTQDELLVYDIWQPNTYIFHKNKIRCFQKTWSVFNYKLNLWLILKCDTLERAFHQLSDTFFNILQLTWN